MVKKRRLSDLSLKAKIILITVILSLVTVVLTALSSYRIITSNLMEQKVVNTLTNLKSISQTINSIVNLRKISAMRATRNIAIIELLTDFEGAHTSEGEYALERFFGEYQNTKGVQSVCVCSLAGGFWASNSRAPAEAECRRLLGKAQLQQASSSWGAPEYREDWVLPYYLPILDPSKNTLIGLMIINFYESELESTYNYYETGAEHLLLLDRAGNVISAKQKDRIGEHFYDLLDGSQETLSGASGYRMVTQEGEAALLSFVDNEPNGLWVVCLGSLESIRDARTKLAGTVLLVVAISFVVVLILAVFLSNNLTKPVNKLVEAIRSMQSDNFDTRVGFRYKDEIGIIGNALDEMSAALKQSSERILEEQKAKREAELKTLLMQINPHFLYNTLSSAIWLVEGGQREESIEVISALSALFKLGVNHGEEETSIGDEIGYIENYLKIQKIRYRNEFEDRIDCPEELARCKTVKLLLQPLVENAIYHGVEHTEGKSEIVVEVRQRAEMIFMRVKNKPATMDFQTMERFNAMLAAGENDASFGVGLKNVNERLKLAYGPEYGVSFSMEDGYTVATVCIPNQVRGAEQNGL